MNFRDHFDFDPSLIHLNNAGMAPIPRVSVQAVTAMAEKIARGGAHASLALVEDLTRSRALFAKMVGTEASHLAYAANLATAMSLVAWGLPFKSGDRILTVDQEYPSNAYVWNTVAREKKLQLDVFKSNADTTIAWDEFISRIKPGTRAVVLSWVQYLTGVTAPLKEVSAACKKAGAWFVVDAIQALGAMPFDLHETGVDIVCTGSHKWMCGAVGHGFLAFREELYMEMTPILQGAMTFGTPADLTDFSRQPWPAAHRFEPGAPGFLQMAATAASTKLILDFGIDRIRSRNMELRERLSSGLSSLGVTLIGDRDSKTTSSIIAFRAPGKIQAVHEALNREKISHAYRLESVRLSPHAYNTVEEMDRTLDVIRLSL